MSRIACLLVPDLPVAALCRADPALLDRPLVVSEGSGPHARVVAAAAPARARGVRTGVHSVAQARAVAADLVVRPRDPAVEASAMRALADVAASLASRCERAADGAVYLDAAGATHLTGSERGLASALVARAARVGLEARVGVGASKTVARLAALHGDGCEVVPAGAELGFLAPLPLACLAPPPDVAATLGRWGVHRLGDLARLPLAEVTTRLGFTGAALVHAARGEDERPLAPSPPPADVEEAVTLEWALDTIEPLLFVLRALVERAVARLGLDGVGCARLGVTLGLDDRSRDVRTLELVAPTRDRKTLLTCLRVALESRPPRAAVVTVAVITVPERVRAAQLGLFTPPGPAPERLATTLARLGALCGPDASASPWWSIRTGQVTPPSPPSRPPPPHRPLPPCRTRPAGSSCVRSVRRARSRCSRSATRPASCAARGSAAASWRSPGRGGSPRSGGATRRAPATTTTWS
jgi:protein ImuB